MERVLREACRVTLAAFGYDTLWKTHALRLLRTLFDRQRAQ
jgi:hypothetical protein